MDVVSKAFIIVGVIFLLLAGLKVAEPKYFTWGWMGLALWCIGMSVSVVVSVR
jgi:hypothetical protein